jgi:hypothetical protein
MPKNKVQHPVLEPDCGDVGPNGGPCCRPRGHSGAHTDVNGDSWS